MALGPLECDRNGLNCTFWLDSGPEYVEHFPPTGRQTDRQAPLPLEVKPSRTSTNQQAYVWAVVVVKESTSWLYTYSTVRPCVQRARQLEETAPYIYADGKDMMLQ